MLQRRPRRQSRSRRGPTPSGGRRAGPLAPEAWGLIGWRVRALAGALPDALAGALARLAARRPRAWVAGLLAGWIAVGVPAPASACQLCDGARLSVMPLARSPLLAAVPVPPGAPEAPEGCGPASEPRSEGAAGTGRSERPLADARAPALRPVLPLSPAQMRQPRPTSLQRAADEPRAANPAAPVAAPLPAPPAAAERTAIAAGRDEAQGAQDRCGAPQAAGPERSP